MLHLGAVQKSEKAQVPINYLTWTYDLSIVFQCFKYVSYDDDSEFTFFVTHI